MLFAESAPVRWLICVTRVAVLAVGVPRQKLFGRLAAAILLCVALPLAHPASAASGDPSRRVALVIGNSAYAHAPALPNPSNDAKAVADTLREAGFEVVTALDTDRRSMEVAVRRFLGALEGAGLGLFYYAGHAVEVGGTNYLVPVDARLAKSVDLDFDAFNLGNLQDYMEKLAPVRLIFLDACRDNPFAGREFAGAVTASRSAAGSGLAAMNAASGTLIAFATASRTTASDGSGRHSPFTSAFLAHAPEPGLEVRQLMTRIRRDVAKATDNAQVPWENSALFDEVYLVPPRAPPVVAALHDATVPADGAPHPLAIPAPRQPAGGRLEATLTTLPEFGRILHGDRPLAAGATLPAADLAALTITVPPDAAGRSGLLRYEVSDEWSGRVPGMVAVIARPAEAGAGQPAATPLETPVADRLGGEQQPVAVTIGAGPQPVRLASLDGLPAGALDAVRLDLETAPESGQLLTGDRVLTAGQNITARELVDLRYRTRAGAEPREDSFRLAMAGRPGGLTVSLDLRRDPCDTLAGEPLDLQGAAPGVLPSDLDVEGARKACTAAILEHPTIGRFFFQLARAELAAGEARRAGELLEQAVRLGHLRALNLHGVLLLRGAYGKADAAGALLAFEAGAAKGDPYAMHSLGKRLFRGDGGRADPQRGLELMLKAAEMGHTYAMNELGAIFAGAIVGVDSRVTPDPVRSIAFYRQSVARDDAFGLNNLGYAYLTGNGVEQDTAQALTLFLKAVERGHPYAATNIGLMYERGTGVAADPAKAALFYLVATKRGDPFAAANIAALEASGALGGVDLARAAKFHALAAAFDQPEPAKAARAAIETLDDKAIAGGIALLVDEMFGARVEVSRASPLGTEAGRVAEGFAAFGIEPPDGLRPTLLALARLSWLRSKPRFDLF